MGMFKMEKPRRFNHQYIYVDERKEKLQKLEDLWGFVCGHFGFVVYFALPGDR